MSGTITLLLIASVLFLGYWVVGHARNFISVAQQAKIREQARQVYDVLPVEAREVVGEAKSRVYQELQELKAVLRRLEPQVHDQVKTVLDKFELNKKDLEDYYDTPVPEYKSPLAVTRVGTDRWDMVDANGHSALSWAPLTDDDAVGMWRVKFKNTIEEANTLYA